MTQNPQIVNYGLIGCGEIAVQTSRAIERCSHSRVVHCMDLRKDLAEDLAAKHGARSTGSVEALLSDPQVEAVVISTPHLLHAPLTEQAARAGKHVLCEKPLATTLGEADRMIAAAGDAGVLLAVLLPTRLGFAWRRAQELVRAGAIGEVVACKLHAISTKPATYWQGGYSGRVSDDWRTSLRKSGGGFLIMNQIHAIDALLSVLDRKPQRVYAEYGNLNTPGTEVEDTISMMLRMDGGAIVSLDGASNAPGGESFGQRIYGQKGQLVIGGTLRVYLTEAYDDIPAAKWVELERPADEPDARSVCVDNFSTAIRTGSGDCVFGPEGRRSLEVARGAYLSMQAGRPLPFPIDDPGLPVS
jgi:UDP-N-acetyl-2-amino-2-deoxyglucuronate dehydrogenase